MNITLESNMIEPIRQALTSHHLLDVWTSEYRSGYGIADLVGMAATKRYLRRRKRKLQRAPLQDRRLVEVLLKIPSRKSISFAALSQRVGLASSTLRSKVLQTLIRKQLVAEVREGMYRRVLSFPNPAAEIVAVEAKIDRWTDAILQARRYSLFANRTYVAISKRAAPRVSRRFLYRHRLGLIGVDNSTASIMVQAPRVRPRDRFSHMACAELLYSLMIQDSRHGHKCIKQPPDRRSTSPPIPTP